jgi:ubiquinone/menaquinone biosynthesis C-methylase UbiE
VLEVATGTGNIALSLAEYAGKVEASDISAEMIRIAQRKLSETGFTNITFSVQDGYELIYPNAAFDVVIASNVLHVMLSPEKALESIKRVMKTDAVFLAPTYCHGHSLLSRTISRIMSLRGFKAHHKWSVPALETFFKTNGFHIAQSQVIGGAVPLVLPVLYKGEKP